MDIGPRAHIRIQPSACCQASSTRSFEAIAAAARCCAMVHACHALHVSGVSLLELSISANSALGEKSSPPAGARCCPQLCGLIRR
jgi:hypothetical protein